MHFQMQPTGGVVLYNNHGDAIVWDVSIFDKTKFSEIEEVFKEINGLFAWMPGDRRVRVWGIYVEIRHVLDNVHTFDALTHQLTHLVTRLYEEITMEDMHYWLGVHGTVKYPDTLLTEYDPDDQSPDSTYLEKDYHGLVVLTAVLRAMIVVWGEYMAITSRIIGPDYKEYVAMRLLDQSSVRSSEAMERLERYIVSRITKDADLAPAVMDGLSSQEIPEWFLANVIIKRMAIGEINALPSKGHIISNIFGFVNNKLKTMSNTFGGIKEKYSEDSLDDEEGGSSFLEMYRVKQSVTIGDVAMFNEYAKRAALIAQSIDPSIPTDQLVPVCAEACRVLWSKPIMQPQVTLVQWTLPSALSPHAIPCLKKQRLIEIMGSVQALLWHWGFFDLAILMSCAGEPIQETDLAIADPRSHIPGDLVVELNRRYPHQVPKEANNARKGNYAYNAITTLSAEFKKITWYAHGPQALLDTRSVAIDAVKRFTLPSTLGEQLTRLVIKIDDLRG